MRLIQFSNNKALREIKSDGLRNHTPYSSIWGHNYSFYEHNILTIVLSPVTVTRDTLGRALWRNSHISEIFFSKISKTELL